MLISEEILRHLVTVLEDRGTGSRRRPALAAAPRATDAERDRGRCDADE